MSRIQWVVLTAAFSFSSWTHASTSFLRGDALYQVTETGGANYMTSQVESSCGAYFVRQDTLYRLEDGGYNAVASRPRVVDPPFFLVEGGSLKALDEQLGVLPVAEGVTEIRYPYYRIGDQLLRWDSRSSTEVADGVTQLTRRGFLKGDQAFSLQGSRSEMVATGVTTLALPYFLRGDSLYRFENRKAAWIASGVQAISNQGFFVRSGNAYAVEADGGYQFIKSAVTSLEGNLVRSGDTLWRLDPTGPLLLGAGVTLSSRNYFLEGDRLYQVGAVGSIYLGAGVSALPCSGRFPLYLQ